MKTMRSAAKLRDMKRKYALLVLSLGVVSACGKPAVPPTAQSRSTPVEATAQSTGTETDRAFLQAMVPHHEMAIEMAKIAEQKATNPVIKSMAGEIIRTQSDEIETMRAIHQRLFNSELKPDQMAHDRLGLTMEESGMKMDMAMLERAANFDKMFAEQMTMHHQGAINMARQALEKTNDAEMRKLAEAIVEAQTKEIETLGKIQ